MVAPSFIGAIAATFLAASSVSPAATASRYSGIAPLGVVFEAFGTTDSGTSRVYKDVAFSWTFGDPGAGMTSHAADTLQNHSKNLAWGPTSTHVFETAGIYPVTMTARGTDGQSRSVTMFITVIDPLDAVFGLDKIYCLSNNTDFTGAPPASSRVVYMPNVSDVGTTIASSLANNIGIYYQGSGAFANSDTTGALNLGTKQVVRVGKFGAGRPTLTNTSATVAFSSVVVSGVASGNPGNDVAIWGVELVSNTANTNSQGVRNYDSNVSYDQETKGFLTIHDVVMTNCSSGCVWQGKGNVMSKITYSSTVGQFGNVGFGSVSNGCNYLGIIDMYVDRGLSGEMGFRLEGFRYLAFDCCYVKNIPNTKHFLTLREMPGKSVGATCYGFTVTNSNFDPIGSSGASSHLQIQPVNASTYGDFSDGVVDHCMFGAYDYSAGGTFYNMPAGLIEARRVDFRHCAINGSSYDAAGAGGGIATGFNFLNANSATPTPAPAADLCSVHHCAYYSSTKIGAALVLPFSNSTNGEIHDNVAYAPLAFKDGTHNGSQGTVVNAPVPASYTVGFNSTDAQMQSVDPQFAVAQPVNFLDFVLKPGTGSYALTAGTNGGALGINPDLSAI